MAYWTCAQLDGRREQLALHCLGLAGFETYQPRIHSSRRASVPLFPSYAFVSIKLQWHAARWAMGVRKIITNGLEPAKVGDHIISELRAREGLDGLVKLPPPLPPAPQFKLGDTVRVRSGPLVGFAGLVSGMRPRQRIEVLLQLLGRVELAAADVALAGE
jgi:transcriptional antiterminator RfaH